MRELPGESFQTIARPEAGIEPDSGADEIAKEEKKGDRSEWHCRKEARPQDIVAVIHTSS
jgi:hypothetical protein